MVNNEFYTLTDLQEALAKAGVPRTRPSLITYEKRGILLRPMNRMGKWRLYTSAELKVNVSRIISYINKRK